PVVLDRLLPDARAVGLVLLEGGDERLDRVARDHPEEEEGDGQRAPERHEEEPEAAQRVGQEGVVVQPAPQRRTRSVEVRLERGGRGSVASRRERSRRLGVASGQRRPRSYRWA